MHWLNTHLPARRISHPAPAPYRQQVQLAPVPQQVQPGPAHKTVRVNPPGAGLCAPASPAAIGVARGGKGAMSPQIFGIYSHFVI